MDLAFYAARDSATYDVWYTFSRDRGESFAEPRRVSGEPIELAKAMPRGPLRFLGAYFGLASRTDAVHLLFVGNGVPRYVRVDRR